MVDLLVTGGTGLVGHALQKFEPDAVYLGSNDFDLTKEDQVIAMFEKFKPKKVIHLAARVGGILDNINFQAEYFYQNVLINSLVVHYAYQYKVQRLVALGSNCAYPDQVAEYPMREEQLHAGPPAATNFSYAIAKRALLTQVEAYQTQYDCDFFAVIPCNLYGPFDKFDQQTSHFIGALIRKLYEVRRTGGDRLKLLGTGRPLRQFLYVDDLVKIILILLEKYQGQTPVNVAPLEQFSIEGIAQIALTALKEEKMKVEFDKVSADGQYRKDISTEKLFKIIGDYKMTPLAQGIKNTYEWYVNQLKGSVA